MSDNKTYAYFFVKGFRCSPESITEILGVEPTDYFCKGERWGVNGICERKENFWCYKTPESNDDYYTNVQFKKLLNLLENNSAKLAGLPKDARIGITYVATCYYPNIAVILDHALLKRIVDLGLSLDFDIYSLTSEE